MSSIIQDEMQIAPALQTGDGATDLPRDVGTVRCAMERSSCLPPNHCPENEARRRRNSTTINTQKRKPRGNPARSDVTPRYPLRHEGPCPWAGGIDGDVRAVRENNKPWAAERPNPQLRPNHFADYSGLLGRCYPLPWVSRTLLTQRFSIICYPLKCPGKNMRRKREARMNPSLRAWGNSGESLLGGSSQKGSSCSTAIPPL